MAEKPLAINYSSIRPTLDIRILTLHPGTDDDPVLCTLRCVARGKEEYLAVSYEWGTETDDDPSIIIQERPVRIRRNLHEALKYIRMPSQDLSVWVDAICINQADVSEKNSQVSQMGETFANAYSVIAWLGTARDHSDIAMDWMSNTEILLQRLPRCHEDSVEFEALVSLCYRPYWRRVWILQEIFLSSSYWVQCGEKLIDGYTFEQSLAALNTVSMAKLDDSPAHQHRMAKELDSRSPELNVLSRWISVCNKGLFQCSREHDWIYALLGISHDYKKGEGSVQVDYNKRPHELYLEFLRKGFLTWPSGTRRKREQLAERMGLNMDAHLRANIESYP